jgi:hypothetical protein
MSKPIVSYGTWSYEKDPQILEPNEDGCVHKMWWIDSSGKTRYAESHTKAGPWVERKSDNHNHVQRAIAGED